MERAIQCAARVGSLCSASRSVRDEFPQKKKAVGGVPTAFSLLGFVLELPAISAAAAAAIAISAATTAPAAAAAATTAAAPTAAAVATATAATTAAAAESTAAAAVRPLAGLVHGQRTTVEILAVQSFDRLLRFTIASNVDEAETARLPRHPV